MLEAAQCRIVRLPSLVSLALRLLPLLPLQLLLQGLAAEIAKGHPELLERLEGYRGSCIGIDPCDLPFAILLEPQRETIRLRVVRELPHGAAHARVCGPILALVGLVDGSYDGDALFFSRDIAIDGDIEVVLALRNAIDDAQIDLSREATAWARPWSPPLDYAARSWRCVARRSWHEGDGA